MGLGLNIGIGDCGYKLLFKIWIGDRDCGSRPGIWIGGLWLGIGIGVGVIDWDRELRFGIGDWD